MDAPPASHYGLPVYFDSYWEDVTFPSLTLLFTHHVSIVWMDDGQTPLVPYQFVAWYVKLGGELLGPLRFMDNGGDGGSSEESDPSKESDPEEMAEP
ncbi:hypothetical protein NL676_030488 [Syzygium grande]|nr:hypothetical protein NL676_030488 [Syzygium grande]